MLGRTETRIRDRIYCQTIRTVRDISRDDRARITTCRLRTLTNTDRLKADYSIDNASKMYYMVLKHYSLHITVHGQVCILAWHAPIMDIPENNQHFSVLI